jgi:hypothetical protein
MNKRAAQSAFLNLRVLIALFMTLVGVVLALLGFGTFAVRAANVKPPTQTYIANSIDPLIPPGFDCSKIYELGIDRQENMRARAIMIACGEAQGAGPVHSGKFAQLMQKLLPSPMNYGTTDVDLITGPDTWPNVTQSTTFTWMNPANNNDIVIGYGDVRCAPNNYSGASVSTDGGFTFTRLTNANGCSPFASAGTNYGDPVILYNRPTGYWYAIWLDMACGGQGIGYYRSTTPWDVNSWAHGCVHSGSNDDRESGWTDMNPSSPFYGRMYVSYNDFAVGGGALYVTHSDDGVVWTPVQLYPSFVRNVQITGDLVTGDVYVAGMNEGGGGLAGPRSNLIFRATDGGNTWTNTYTGSTFFGPGRCDSGYFACMYCSPSPGWRHMGWGQPAAINHVVHYVYAQCGQNVACDTATDHGDVYYIRSTDSGVTFSAPFKLNTDTGTAAQWEPNLSVSPSGSVFAVWYDERTGGTCTAGANTPCYQMFARKSNDNGVTWLPDAGFSDVVSPLPGTATGGIVGSDYDYQMAIATSHRTGWMDGRVPINNTQQADVFSDGEGAVGGTPTPTPSPAGCSVISSSPPCGGIVVGTPPTDFTVNLTAPADGAQGSDFTVNGTPAIFAILSNNDTTITFHFNTSPVVQGLNTMHIPAGAFPCGEPGGSVQEFTCTFTYQASTPTPTPTPTATSTPRSQPTPRSRPTPPPPRP